MPPAPIADAAHGRVLRLHVEGREGPPGDAGLKSRGLAGSRQLPLRPGPEAEHGREHRRGRKGVSKVNKKAF